MVRTISSNALNTLAQRLGNEPVTIVEVDWADGVVPRLYADRTISTATGTIPGEIIEAGDVDDAIDVTTYNNTSKQVSLTLGRHGRLDQGPLRPARHSQADEFAYTSGSPDLT